MAKQAFRLQPQLLEKIGILYRTSLNPKQRNAAKKAAATNHPHPGGQGFPGFHGPSPRPKGPRSPGSPSIPPRRTLIMCMPRVESTSGE
jgi:hypothetical protein